MKTRYIFVLIQVFLTIQFTSAQDTEEYHSPEPLVFNSTLTTNTSATSFKSITLTEGFSTNGMDFSASALPAGYELNYKFEEMKGHNYKRRVIPKTSIKYLAEINFLTTGQVYDEISYVDGLGRAIQSQVMGISGQAGHMVQLYSYGQYGRQDTLFLPFVEETDGFYLDEAQNIQKQFYNNSSDHVTDDDSPFSTIIYEESPLSRVLEAGAPGDYWQTQNGHTVTNLYGTNSLDEVIKWVYDETTETYKADGTGYASGTLNEITTTDENGITIKTYTDGNGKTLKITQEGLETYYVYDYLDRLVHILPPEFIEKLEDVNNTIDTSNTLVKQYCYTYVYGERGLLIKKHLPGIAPIEYVYDKLNRPVMARNGNLKKLRQWSFVKFGPYGRPAYSGLYTNRDLAFEDTRECLQASMDIESNTYETFDEATGEYSNNVFPTISINLDIHIINYYNYYPSGAAAYLVNSGFPASATTNTKGMLTARKVKRLDNSDYLESVFYYDEKGQMIQSQTENVFGMVDIVSYDYSFIGQVETLCTEHGMPGGGVETITKYYAYDAAGHVVSIEQEIEGDAANGKVKMAEMEYNKLGQVTTKKLHETASNDFLQNIDYEYNIRGWLTQVNDPDAQGTDNDLFAMRLHYHDEITQNGQSSQILNNGMISAIEWNVFGDNPQKRTYSFTYDNHYRLTNAHYSEGEGLGQAIGRYDVNLTYYANGKIHTLQRYGLIDAPEGEPEQYGLIDELTYEYTGNQLTKVTDNIAYGTVQHTVHFPDKPNVETQEYLYDDNGNMIFDANKDLQEITYNHLNLPELVYFDDNNLIEFTYDAAGNKLSKRVLQAGIEINYKFVGSFIYEDDVLKQFMTEEGRVAINGTTYSYEYFLRDQLGSVRVMFKEGTGGEAEVLQENHYYPFGMRIAGLGMETETNNTLFSGKNLNPEAFGGINLSWYDFHARNYDPQLGMWFNVDPLMEYCHDKSPYTYCFNNPINFVDPTGMSNKPWYWNDDIHGEWTATDEMNWSKFGNGTAESHGPETGSGYYHIRYEYSSVMTSTDWYQLGATISDGVIISLSWQFLGTSYFYETQLSVSIDFCPYSVGAIEFQGIDTGGGISSAQLKPVTTTPVLEQNAQSDGSNFSTSDNLFGNINLNDIGTITSAMSIVVTKKVELVKWGLKSLSIPDGTKYLKGWKGFGKGLGYLSTGIYGFNSYSDFASGNDLQGVSNGLMSIYSFIATKGGIVGTVITSPFFIIDWTIGMDNFLLYQVNYGIEQSYQIQNGNWGVSMWRPGKCLR